MEHRVIIPRERIAVEAAGGYRASPGSRIFGAAGALAVCALIGAVLLLGLVAGDRRPQPHQAAFTAFALHTPTPPAPPHPARPHAAPQVPHLAAAPAPSPRPALVLAPAPAPQPAPMPTATAAPTPPPPPAPAPASVPPPVAHGPDRWEGRVLARLERFRLYPAEARRAHVQGTATIRFRLDRAGHVLSAALARSSGDAALDAAALDTLRRADPLPRIPPDRPDEVQLLVPIEFTLSG